MNINMLCSSTGSFYVLVLVIAWVAVKLRTNTMSAALQFPFSMQQGAMQLPMANITNEICCYELNTCHHHQIPQLEAGENQTLIFQHGITRLVNVNCKKSFHSSIKNAFLVPLQNFKGLWYINMELFREL